MLEKVGSSSASCRKYVCDTDHSNPILLSCDYFSSGHMTEEIFVVEILGIMYLS